MSTPNKKLNFLRWFITFSATLVLMFFMWAKGLAGIVITNDTSYLSIIILGLFFLSSLYAGLIAHRIDTNPSLEENYAQIKESTRILDFLSGNFFALGLLGTIIGFCYTMYNALSGAEELGTILGYLKKGMGTAGYATLTGIVCSIIMDLQIFFLTHFNHHEK